jgi:FkbM family methyltransferase
MTAYSIPPGVIELPDDLPPKTRRDMARGRYECHKTDLISQLQPGDLFIDVGAHVGYHSLWALAAGARVIAFEPHIHSFQAFLLNMDDNGYQNARDYRLSNRIVWSCVSQRPFFRRRSSVHHSTLGKKIAGEPIVDQVGLLTTTTLDTELPRQVAMVKIDVQGAELHVLAGMRTVLANNPTLTLLVEAHQRYGVTEAQVRQQLVDYPDVKVVF